MMLNDKTIIVTGANGTVGQAVVDVAIAEGASVIAVDRQFSSQRDNVRQIVLDLTDAAAVLAEIGAIDIVDGLFNIAGGFAMGPTVHETGVSEWEAMFAMNVTTALNMCTVVVPKMLAVKKGAIVNVGAMSAREGQGNMGAYCVAKSAVMRLTESLSKELRHFGINVNAVLPSIIDTPANRADMPDMDHKMWVEPHDLANVICYLGSTRASALHGALVPVVGLS